MEVEEETMESPEETKVVQMIAKNFSEDILFHRMKTKIEIQCARLSSMKDITLTGG